MLTHALWPLLSILSAVHPTPVAELRNERIHVELALNEQLTPYIAACRWVDDDAAAFHGAGDASSDSWACLDFGSLPEGVETRAERLPWGQRVTISRALVSDLVMSWVIELPRDSSTLRLHTRLHHGGDTPLAVPWFPIWGAQWQFPGANQLKWWKALSFEPVEQALGGELSVTLGSHLHSSDTRDSDGVNPYWCVAHAGGRVYFALEWCGGWEATLRGDGNVFGFSARLPESETQLVLQPGETIDGPVLCITPTRGATEAECRREWMLQRAQFAHEYYGGPAPDYFFTYNHWYTTRFDLTGRFLRRQARMASQYGFDFFLVDAGWYEGMGKWRADPKKFKPGELEDILADVAAEGIPTGIWTCPQFVSDGDSPAVDHPGFYEKFIDGHLLDLAGSDFPAFLTDHVERLRAHFGITWWKYDQVFFAPETRAGVMRNVLAFQDAVWAVRKANPDLYIENCQSGGRMINEFTVLITQNQWIRDGGRNGLEHARSNFKEALGAIEFMPPWSVNRWTNNPGQMKHADSELMRYYCRSAMAGTWGLVADLADIGHSRKKIIKEEIANYREFSEMKADYLYEVIYPHDGQDFAGVTFFDADGSQAAALVLRWDANGEFTARVPVPHLRTTWVPAPRSESDEDADVVLVEPEGDTPALSVAFDEDQDSRIVWYPPLEVP
ncbi:MAG: alpha-galactosidase [Candidatus Hydrogenedentes bacterium]|nr:alpha-galactosidase [Candidatus Hydrogenedentota bacterium]